ncbi:MAG: ExeA family protein [Candidatus Brocadiales bacterium]|nr:ExeA family protein [Candidatus Brocadiales bacterium]
MMRTVFSLTDFPFLKDVKEIYRSKDLNYLWERLSHCLETQGIVLLTGEIGSGKTTACQSFLASINPNTFRPIYLSSNMRSPRGFFQNLVSEMGLLPKFFVEDLIIQAKNHFSEIFIKQGLLPILVIDEAQNLSDTILEDIRLLTNFRMDSRSMLTIFLLAHPVLKARLKLSAYAAFRRRVSFAYHLIGFTLDEAHHYMAHRLKAAGSTTPLFTEDAIRLIFNYSKGLPGLINPLAHEALYLGALNKASSIEASLIEQIIKERDWF